MGYTHYWRRQETIKEEVYKAIVDDFSKLLPIFERSGVKLAGGMGEGKPQVDYNDVRFNGATNCGHKANLGLVIPWPNIGAKGVGDSKTAINGKWFAGAMIDTRCCDGDCSYETFHFPITDSLGHPDDGLYFNFCKTAFRPYDWAVTAFLVIAKHHLGDKIQVSSDGEIQHWHDAMLLCQLELGYGMDFKLPRG